MSNVVPFPARPAAPTAPEPAELDLLSAVDFAIRDLRDIAIACTDEARSQAHDCMDMLERALHAALREG
jgi:hypothetical protein